MVRLKIMVGLYSRKLKGPNGHDQTGKFKQPGRTPSACFENRAKIQKRFYPVSRI